jgi:hypothetical protein
MIWVLAAIGCFVVIHTLVNLASRKPQRPHEPAAEARERQHSFVQADMKGWTRYAARLSPAAEAAAISEPATITRAPAPAQLARALPFDLVGIFTTDPRLYRAPASLAAPATLDADAGLRVRFNFGSTGKAVALGEPLAFAKDRHLYLFLQDETRVVPDEEPTPFAPALELTLPPAVLPAGTWQASLYASDGVFSWEFTVPDGAAP